MLSISEILYNYYLFLKDMMSYPIFSTGSKGFILKISYYFVIGSKYYKFI